MTAGRKLDALLRPGFLAGLSLLLANDFILKPVFHDVVTGKLSDFAGLWVFPAFWAALWPRKAGLVYVATGLTFAGWKSDLSQPMIDAWNVAVPLHMHRVVDATDLGALLMLPPSFAYFAHLRAVPYRRGKRSKSLLLPAVMLVSLFAFTATSSIQNEIYVVTFDETSGDNVFHFDRPAGQIGLDPES